MAISDRLSRIRRFLRDPNAKIWEDAFLLQVYNDVQQEVQNKTRILEQLTTIRIPPSYRFSYLFDFEWIYLPTTEKSFFQCLKQNQQSDLVYTNDWEAQQIWQVTPDVDSLGAEFAHPWEAWYLTPDKPVNIRFPLDFRNAKFIAYDKDPLTYAALSDIQKNDSSHKTAIGTPYAYYRHDNLDNSFILYPRPSTASWADGDGVAMFGSDSVSGEYGQAVRRTYSTLTALTGVDLDYVDLDDNVFLVYEVNTTDVTASSESQFPEYLLKFIDYGVLARAYMANTDGRIKSLADYWQRRYEVGLKTIQRYKAKRMTARNYTMGASQVARRNKHPRLPSTYPDVNNF